MGLSNQTVEWLQSITGHSTFTIEPLLGGMSSKVFRITHNGNSTPNHYVLRKIDNESWLKEEPDLAFHEASSLHVAKKVNVPTPQILAYDQTGEKCGFPSVLMTQLNGKVVLDPPQMMKWIRGLANALTEIHRVKPIDFPWTYFTYQNLQSFQVPAWSKYPEQWGKLVSYARLPSPEGKSCFIHRDYHPANVLWENGQVSGIVDWVNACIGPPGVDIGHCRVNIAQLFGVEAANEFLTAYQKVADADFSYHPYWDVIALIDILFGPPEVYPGWTALGASHLSNELMVERLDEYMLELYRFI